MRDYFERTLACPHCGHSIKIMVDASEGDQDYYEDCSDCCNPMHITVKRNELKNKIELSVDADDEQIF